MIFARKSKSTLCTGPSLRGSPYPDPDLSRYAWTWASLNP